LIPGLATITVSTAAATPAFFLSHVSQNPYLNPLKHKLDEERHEIAASAAPQSSSGDWGSLLLGPGHPSLHGHRVPMHSSQNLDQFAEPAGRIACRRHYPDIGWSAIYIAA
jgi:hypothetical protein